MKKINSLLSPDLQGTNFRTGMPGQLEKGGGGGTGSAQARLGQQRRLIRRGRKKMKQERVVARTQLQRVNRQMRGQANRNRAMLDDIIGANTPETEFIDNRDEVMANEIFGLSATRGKLYGQARFNRGL